MNSVIDRNEHATGSALKGFVPVATAPRSPAYSEARVAECHHCGEPCTDTTHASGGKIFCCHGCCFVHDLLTTAGLNQFYELIPHPGVRVTSSNHSNRWEYLDEPNLRERLLDFSDGTTCLITLHVPAIHCIACVWLLENLFRLHEGIGSSQVNFPRREVAIRFFISRIKLGELVALLSAIGYEPTLTLRQLEKPEQKPLRTRQWLQAGIAGFAFGNIMLFSLPTYLGMDGLTGHGFKSIFGYLSLLLALPVLVYSASDYWQAALLSFKRRVLTLDVPIALGIAALYAQSAFEIFSGRGEGYLDSLAGLVFFLLCGRIFQQTTHDRITFDRDYKSFFPLSVIRKTSEGEQNASISDLHVGDRLVIRNGELIPADARLIRGPAFIDYSFVTGESEPVPRQAGDYIYAGGQQTGGAIELETLKPVSQSYLTSLWNHETFQKNRENTLNSLTNQYSRRFTRIVLAAAIGAAIIWIWRGDTVRGIKAFISVLIVACPCALALAAPFALGTAQRLLTRARIFLRNGLVIEDMARIDAIVFDKTGTLTASTADQVTFHPAPLDRSQTYLVAALTRHSTHPQALRICKSLHADEIEPDAITDFRETPGFGISGIFGDNKIVIGSCSWLQSHGTPVPKLPLPSGTTSFLAINGEFLGVFVLSNKVRPEIKELLDHLGRGYELALLSGDNERERETFRQLFPPNTRLKFNQSPIDKLDFVSGCQESGKKVMMIGDGLNDAGALRQSDVGIAVVEKVGSFSPASDAIIAADQVSNISRLLNFSRATTKVIRLSFLVSAVYNVAGITIAAAGILSPIICAVLMPLSSVSVVVFACAATGVAARKSLLLPGPSTPFSTSG